MGQHRGKRWNKMRRAALVLTTAALPFAFLDGAAVYAQSIMRTPNINVGSRVPSIDTVSRINPNIAVNRTVTGIDRATPRLSPACSYAYRDSAGECRDQPVTSTGGGGTGGGSKSVKNKNDGPRRNTSLTGLNLRTVANELVAEIDGSLSDAQADELARRHRLERIASQNFLLVGGTIGLFRIVDRRPADIVSRELATEASVRSVQPNFRYLLQDQTPPTEGDPAQYALAKLRLPEAHRLAHGANVTIAVIDSGIDIRHPELANAIAGSFDALGSKEGPHVHGTAVAGAIAAHARLMGSAPAASILAIRAFGPAPSGAESTSFVVLKALD